jgi:hypothetical protein
LRVTSRGLGDVYKRQATTYKVTASSSASGITTLDLTQQL